MASGGMGRLFNRYNSIITWAKAFAYGISLVWSYVHGLAGEEASKDKYNTIASRYNR